MALDLFLNKEHESIGNSEEGLFYLIQNKDGFPTLEYIWEEFYNGPKITPEMSGLLVEELITILGSLNGSKTYTKEIFLISRLLPFFKKAHKLGVNITCQSD